MFRRAILLSALLVCVGPLSAAPVPVGPKADDSVSPSAVKLLHHRRVQKELKMTAEQRIAIVDGLADLEEEFDKKVEELSRKPDAPDEAFDKLDKEHKKGIEKLMNDTATKSLTAPQRKRLGQLDARIRGVAAFTDERVAKLLQLTDAQKKTAAELTERQKNAADSFLDNQGNDDDAKRKADLFKSRKEFLKQMEDALTADQKPIWAALLGDAPTSLATDDLWLKIEDEGDAPGPGGPGVIGK